MYFSGPVVDLSIDNKQQFCHRGEKLVQLSCPDLRVAEPRFHGEVVNTKNERSGSTVFFVFGQTGFFLFHIKFTPLVDKR